MSLRGFHIFFISFVTLASFVIAAVVWGLGFNPMVGTTCALFGVVAAVYGLWFIRKSRKLIL
jgi:uncharacterized membrane protein YqjE